jgi:ribosome silencing factor RsfS/YbeB/iojap
VPVKKQSTSKSGAKSGEKSAGAAKAKRSSKTKVAGRPKVAAEGKTRTPRAAAVEPSSAAKALARSVELKAVVIGALEDMKALEIKVLDVRGLTDVADTMVIASGTSDRHVRSVAQKLVEKTKAAGFRPHGVEGQQDSDWVLIDLSEMIVHVMLPRVREFYGLEKLWDMTQSKRAARA